MRPVTPRGFRDVLLDEAVEREAVVEALTCAFDAWGYLPVETPVVELFDTIAAVSTGATDVAPFRFFDSDGELLALRPDMTVPVARVAATRLADEPMPFRVRYIAPVFREHASLRGQARQFTQAGIELIGEGGPAADAEVVAIACEALRAAGLPQFNIAVGSVQVLGALAEAAGMPEAWRDAVLRAAHLRNLPEVERLAGVRGVSREVARGLVEVLTIRGGHDALDACSEALSACGCAGAVEGLRETYAILEDQGHAESVVIDFGTVRSFGYYTGLVMQVYAPGLGLPLGGGGRYDGLLAAFERPAPAAGFAIGLERLTIALAEQGATPRARALDAVVGGEDARACFQAGALLRAAGWRVRVAPGSRGLDVVRAAERSAALEAVEAVQGVLRLLDRAGEPAGVLEKPLPAPPSATWARRDQR